MVAENVVTDRQTDRHTYKPSTVTFAVHVRRGLISIKARTHKVTFCISTCCVTHTFEVACIHTFEVCKKVASCIMAFKHTQFVLHIPSDRVATALPTQEEIETLQRTISTYWC